MPGFLFFWRSKNTRNKQFCFSSEVFQLGPKFQVCLRCLDQGELLPCDADTQSLSSLAQARGVRYRNAAFQIILVFILVFPVHSCSRARPGLQGCSSITHQRFSSIRLKPNSLLGELSFYLRGVHERKLQNNDFYGICQYFHFSLTGDLNYY